MPHRPHPQSHLKPSRLRLIGPAILLAGLAAMGTYTLVGRAPTWSPMERRDRPVRIEPAAAAATPAATAPSAPTPVPRREGRVEVVFLHSGSPATGIVVLHGRTGAGSRAQQATEADGTFDARGLAGEVRLFDPETSLTLGVMDASALATGRVVVAEPIRVAGRFPQHSPGLEIKLGTGARVFAHQRQREESGSTLRPGPGENRPFGLEMPKSAESWRDLPLDPEGRFTSRHFLADETPQLLARDAEGRALAREVELPKDLAPRATIDLGELALPPPTGLAVTIDIPGGELAANIELGIRKAIVEPGSREEAARLLSIIDRAGERLSSFARGEGSYILTGAGRTVIAPLPPMESLELVARGAIPELLATRTLSIPAGTITEVHFAQAELFPTGGKRIAMKGRVVLAGSHQPIEGATIAMSAFRQRAETTTGPGGGFEFTGVPTDQLVSFLIQAEDGDDPPKFQHTETKQFPRLAESPDPFEVEWEIPARRWLEVTTPPGTITAVAPELVVAVEELTPGAAWGLSPVHDVEIVEAETRANIERPGTFRVVFMESPLVLHRSQPATFGPDDFEKRVDLEPSPAVRDAADILVLDQEGKPAPGVAVFSSSGFSGRGALELFTDADGVVHIGPVNLSSVEIQIGSELGRFEKMVELAPEGATTIKLVGD